MIGRVRLRAYARHVTFTRCFRPGTIKGSPTEEGFRPNLWKWLSFSLSSPSHSHTHIEEKGDCEREIKYNDCGEKIRTAYSLQDAGSMTSQMRVV